MPGEYGDECARAATSSPRPAQALPRAAGDERTALPRGADLLHPGEALVPDGADELPRRRPVRDLVRRAAQAAVDARRGRSRALLYSAVRRPSRLARDAARRCGRLGTARRDRGGRLRPGGTAEAA